MRQVRKYTKEFKQEAVNLALKSPSIALSYSITQTLMPPPKKMVTVQRRENQLLDQAPGSEPNLVRQQENFLRSSSVSSSGP